MTELTPTLKISAASRRDAPLSTASTARSRKSVEYGLGMDLAPRANQFLQTRLGESTWESPRFNPTGKCSRIRHLRPIRLRVGQRYGWSWRGGRKLETVGMQYAESAAAGVAPAAL